MRTDLDLETLIILVKNGDIRMTSYSNLYTGKEARKAIEAQLRRLQDILEGDYLGEDQ